MSEEKRYVKVSELEVGRVYGGFRNWNIYLGRTTTGGFMWLYIGGPRDYVVNPLQEAIYSLTTGSNLREGGALHITKQNKRIEPSKGKIWETKLDIGSLPSKYQKLLIHKGLKLYDNIEGSQYNGGVKK